MSQFDNSITQRGTIIDISYADLAGASNGSVNIDGRLKNRSLTSQVSHEVRGAIAGLGAIYSSVNTALDQSFTVTALIAAGSDYMVIEDFTLELLPG